ncbi:MAG: tyrosine-type recombinase/integrase [Actinomycetota bacterium]|nr:tyrosine-type recombinase/integrase [Actinomycetota bacterium]
MRPTPVLTWKALELVLPVMSATMLRYLQQLSCSLRPASVRATDQGLRLFATFIFHAHPAVTSVAQLKRTHLEDYKRWLIDDLDHPFAGPGRALSATSRSLRLGSLRMFFTRITEWDYDDAPARPLLFTGDLPVRDQVLPKALDDADAGKFLRSAQAQPRLLVRVVAEVLIRTGVRVGEFCDLQADAIRTGHDGFWLHVPVGKLHDDRYLPLHPVLVELIGDYRRQHVQPGNPMLIPYENGRPLKRAAVARMLDTITTAAGMAHIHPHKLRHTLATQAINRGMSMEAIAALLGHHSLDMTRRYARLHDKTLQRAYFDVTDRVDALYDPAAARNDVHAELRDRLLGNGRCSRPRQLPCDHDLACENCVFFQTSIAFRPVLQAQHDDAATKGQNDREDTFTALLERVDKHAAS